MSLNNEEVDNAALDLEWCWVHVGDDLAYGVGGGWRSARREVRRPVADGGYVGSSPEEEDGKHVGGRHVDAHPADGDK